MLAIASLHIAKLQNGPVSASLKHYAIGLRSVGKLINHPERQREPATLAAAMLLAFYECWCADHQKWSNHLLGARQLLRVIDFADMSRHIRRARIQRREQGQMRYHQQQQQGLGDNIHDETLRHPASVDEVDENLLGLLMGIDVRYEDRRRVINDNAKEKPREYSQRELDDYELQRDLYWWYCKQDAYQSILGGGRLL
jgi:hypothetical protein